jgi:hypothetical protein
MLRRRRAPALAIAALVFCACATAGPTPTGSVREILPRVGDREVMLTDRSGRNIRLTLVQLVGDSVVGIKTDGTGRAALSVDDVQQVQVFGNDPVSGITSSYGVLLILLGAAALTALIAHIAGG